MTEPRTVVPVTTPSATSAAHPPSAHRPATPPPAVEDEQVEIPRQAEMLMAGLVNYLVTRGITYELINNGQALVIARADTPGGYVYCSATLGILHMFVGIGIRVPESEGPEQIEAYTEGLTNAMPVPRAFDPSPELGYPQLSRYAMVDSRDLGLWMRLPMPRTFSTALTFDGLWLADWLFREVARNK